ncbi:DUF2007 domain-containing protein [Saccharospirillum sp. HFRX-1]|uniref:putative signal transducing protein n=1 Tax=unclassified Saccharospirillum TaxID=2633430 RepID=UPI00371BE856
MKLVYTHPHHFAVNNVRNRLLQRGIECEVRNEFAAGALGELAPIDVWPELWVLDERDVELAQRLIEADQSQAEGRDWYCGQCGELNAASFDHCWACERERRLE